MMSGGVAQDFSVIPDRAKQGLENLFLRHLSEALTTSAHTEWTVRHLDSHQEIQAQEFIILTVSSYDLRTFVLLHFSKNPASLSYVSRALDTPLAGLSDDTFYDYLGEVGNRFCGAFKRELGKALPHLGMSTPNRLGSESLCHLQGLPCGHDLHVEVRTPDDIVVYASLYVSTYGKEEFRIDDVPIEEAAVETGELEMF